MKILPGILLLAHATLSAQWSRVPAVPAGSAVYSLATSNDTLFAGTDSGFYIGGAAQWTPGVSPVPSPDAICTLINVNGNIVAGTLAGGAFRSTDAGASWLPFSSGLTAIGATHFGSIAVRRDSLLAATLGAGVYATPADFAHPWVPWGDSLSDYEGDNVFSMIVVGSTALAGAGGNGVIFRYTDGQPWWNPVPLRVPPIIGQTATGMATDGSVVLAATNFGVFRSTDRGSSWSSTNLTPAPQTIQTLLIFDARTAMALSTTPLTTSLFVSSDTGRTWTPDGVFGIPNALSVAIAGNTLFLGTGAGLWEAPLSGLITSLKTVEPVAVEFRLGQSFPNPCNPSAWITFESPASARMNLSVYDLLGRRVSVLADGSVEAGVHRLRFDGSGLPSGVYFYRLESGTTSLTRALLLVK